MPRVLEEHGLLDPPRLRIPVEAVEAVVVCGLRRPRGSHAWSYIVLLKFPP